MSNTLQLCAGSRPGIPWARSTLRASGAVLVVRQRGHQIRTFRFGRFWTSYLNSDWHNDIYRQHRKLRYKLVNSLSRRASWEKQLLENDAWIPMKRMIHAYWHPASRKSRWGGRHASNNGDLRHTDDAEGVRPGQNIEDVERAPMESLLYGYTSHNLWRSTSESSRNTTPSEEAPSSTTEPTRVKPNWCSVPEELVLANGIYGQYTIDPITNRKVFKPSNSVKVTLDHGKTVEVPVKVFQILEHGTRAFNPLVFKFTQIQSNQDGFTREANPKKSDKVDTLQVRDEVRHKFVEENGSMAEKLPTFETEGDQNGYFSPAATSENTSREKDIDGDGVVPLRNIDATKKTIEPIKGQVGHLSWKINPEYFGDKDSDNLKPSNRNKDSSGEKVVTKGDELNKYSSGVLDDIATAKDEPPQTYKDLGNYGPFSYHEPDGNPAAGKGKSTQSLEDSRPLRRAEWDENMLKVEETEVDQAELSKYQAFRYNEPNGKPPLTMAQANKYDAADLQQYEAFRYNEPDGKRNDGLEVSPVSEHLAKGLSDLGMKQLRELDKNFVAELVSDGEQVIHRFTTEPLPEKFARTVKAKRDEIFREGLEQSLSKHITGSDAADAEAVDALKRLREMTHRDKSQPLTGNYVRDFPEEFAKTWTSDTFTSTEPMPSKEQQLQSDERQEVEGIAFESPILQPALDRQKGDARPQIATQSTDFEQPEADLTFMRTYSSLDDSGSVITPSQTEQTATTSSQQPTVYKLLAYDPTMQTINTAETTSVVPDTASPLTPAEVLLRLSNPSKFFPHFGPLQAQGFEIVSGSGDVLVFRKVRIPETVSMQSTSSTMASNASIPPLDNASRTVVNPIDMTGHQPVHFPSPVTARFASPTGFVNYNLPPPPAETSRFVSGIDVRREEPVFSGSKTTATGQQQQKDSDGRSRASSLPKRIAIGAVWVAGVSYALGVVGEYFSKGTNDQKSSKRFN